MADRKYGVVLPEGQAIGDRADRACVMAALELVRREGIEMDFNVMEAAIDMFLAEAAKRGWKLRDKPHPQMKA